MKWFEEFLGLFKEQKDEFRDNPSVQFGATGTEIYGGYLEEEFLGELKYGRQRYEKYHQMRSSSGIIKMCLKSVRDPIRGATFGFTPLSNFADDPVALAQAEFMEAALPKTKLDALINDMSTAVIFGFYLGELFYEVFDYEGKKMLRPCVKYLSQRTISRWMIDPTKGLVGITQEAFGDTTEDSFRIEINADKLVHFAIEQEGDNYEGISMMRAIYGNWVRKNANLKKIALGNHFLAMPYLKIYPEGGGKLDKTQQDELEARLVSRSKGSQTLSHLIFPKGWKAEEQSTNFDPMKIYQCNKEEDIEIVRAFCANFLLLTSGAGTHTLSNDLSTFFLQGLEEIAKVIDASITRYVINRAISANFGTKCLIESSHSEIGGKGGLKLADALLKLISSQSITPDEPLEAWIRTKYGLPRQDHETSRHPLPDAAKEEADDFAHFSVKKKRIEFSSSTKLRGQALRSSERINKFREEYKALLKEEFGFLVAAKVKKMSSFVKKHKGTKDIFRLGADKLFISSSSTISRLTDFIINVFKAEAEDLSSAMQLSWGKLKSILIAKLSFKNMINDDVLQAVSEMDVSIVRSTLEVINSIDDPEELAALIFKSTTTKVASRLSNSKSTAIPSLAVNSARKYAFDARFSDIVSYTFYNQSPVAKICIGMNGKIIAKEDFIALGLFSPPCHYNCNSVLYPNLASFSDNPMPDVINPTLEQRKSISLGPLSV